MESKLARGTFDYSEIGLVRDEPIDVPAVSTGGTKRLLSSFDHSANRKPIYDTAIHADVWTSTVRRAIQNRRLAAIRMHTCHANSGLDRGRHDYGARAVAKQNTRRTIIPVEKARHLFGADNEDVSRRAFRTIASASATP